MQSDKDIMVMTSDSNESELKQKINQETARIHWRELQRFFASGLALHVDSSLDLIDVAQWMSADKTDQIKRLMEDARLAPVNDRQAQQWYDANTEVWAVVIKPWVLIQDK